MSTELSAPFIKLAVEPAAVATVACAAEEKDLSNFMVNVFGPSTWYTE
jgi:hypothetical protein